MQDVVERDGVRYSVCQDLHSGDYRVEAYAPPRRSYEMELPPGKVIGADEYDDPYGEIEYYEREIIERPEIREAIVIYAREVRDWREARGYLSLPDAEAALYCGIEQLQPHIEEQIDPELHARREEERAEAARVAEKKRIAAEKRAKARAEAKRLEEERKAREQDALEALPEYGLF